MPNHKRLSVDEEKKAVQMYEDGQKAQEVAKVLGVAHQTVLNALKKNGVRLRMRKERFVSSEKLQEMRAMYESGHSFKEVAEYFGLSWDLVNRLLRDCGVQPRPAGFQKGAAHHAWNGGVTVNSSGYMMERVYLDDPFFSMAQVKVEGASYAPQHRLVMARHLGRPLEEHETVHHIDGNKLNNSLENLQLRSGKHGKGVILQCADCGSHNINSRPIH